MSEDAGPVPPPSSQPHAPLSLEPRLAFDRVAVRYDRVRPTYPESLVDDLFASLPPKPRIAEVGPGTGQATGPLLDRGGDVTAVEIGENLVEFLRNKFEHERSLRVMHADFETVALAPLSFDAVLSACAYHWISPAVQLTRPAELLKPGGTLALLDLIQVESPTNGGYFERVQPIYEKYGQARPGWKPPSYENAEPAIASRLRADSAYRYVQVTRVKWDQSYSSTVYRDLLLTFSGPLMMAPVDRTAMVDELVSVVDQEFGGTVTRPLVVTLTQAQTK